MYFADLGHTLFPSLPVGLVSFQSASYRVRERSSGSTLEVCVQLTGGLEIPLSVTLSTQNNTALGEGVRRRYVCLLKKVHILNHSC